MTKETGISPDDPLRRKFLAASAGMGIGTLAVPAALTCAATLAARPARADVVAPDSHAVTMAPVPDISGVTRASLDIGEAEIAYFDTGGDGEVVVLLHPGSIASDCFAYQLARLAAAGYRVIAWDRRSYGNSTAGPEASDASDASDMALLLDGLGIETCHAVGAAAGGIRLADFVLEFPDRVGKVVYAGTTLRIREDDYAEVSARLLPENFGDMPVSFRELGPAYRAANFEGADAWAARAANRVPGGSRTSLGLSTGTITWEKLASMDLPILLLTGDADLYSPPSVMDLFRERMNVVDAVVINGAGHAPYWEQAELFNETLLGFLGSDG